MKCACDECVTLFIRYNYINLNVEPDNYYNVKFKHGVLFELLLTNILPKEIVNIIYGYLNIKRKNYRQKIIIITKRNYDVYLRPFLH